MPTKIVITGHVDHGKSTLIGRLLFDTHSLPQAVVDELTSQGNVPENHKFAYLLDYLAEEREKNITIDTTQLPFRFKSKDFVIIDAPGHKEFTHNMVTGSAEADLPVIVIAANEGIAEQTKRHTYFLKLLGFTDVVVVINKMDLVSYSQKIFDFIVKEFSGFAATCGLRVLQYVPISAYSGENLISSSPNLAWYQGPGLADVLAAYVPAVQRNTGTVFSVQDVYESVVVGRVEAGTLARGQELTDVGHGTKITVREIKKWNEKTDTAHSGEAVGVLFDDTNLRRGDILAEVAAKFGRGTVITGTLFWLDARPYTSGESLTLECLTQETACTITEIESVVDSSTLARSNRDDGTICYTEVAQVRIKTDQLVVYCQFRELPELGRFVLLRDGIVVAGGTIL